MKTVSKIFFAMALAATAFSQESDQARSARLSELENSNARTAQFAARRASVAQPRPEAVQIGCQKPVFFSSGVFGAAIQWLCDLNRDGTADVVGTFWNGEGRVAALATVGGYLYAHNGQSSILRFTDTNNDGVADGKPDEVMAGAPYTERLLPVGVDRFYAEDNGSGRLLRYNVGLTTATVFNIGLPKLGNNINATFISPVLRTLFTVDQNESVVKAFPVDANGNIAANQGRTVYKGERIANITVDENAGLLFVTKAGQCISAPPLPTLPGSNNVNQSSVPSFCSSGALEMVRLNQNPFNQGSAVTTLATGGYMFNVQYGPQSHSMLAVDGRVYVVVFESNPNFGNNSNQLVVSYDYAKPVENQPGTVFANSRMLGDGFVTSLTAFPGGPVANISVNVP